MWIPPERVRHTLPEGDWPDAETARRARLFSPVAIGSLEVEQRTWIPAMVPWRATDEGEVTEDVLDWYGRFARGRPGVIVVEATGVRDIPSGPLLRIGHDRFLPGLQRLVERVRAESQGHTRLFIQLIDFLAVRRRPPKDKFLERFLTLTEAHRSHFAEGSSDAEIRQGLLAMSDQQLEEVLSERECEDLFYGYRERVTDTHLEGIRELPRSLPPIFAQAAARARRAGFDGVELHYAHAYTMASFLSRLNTRRDGYGTTLEGRVRLPLEVYAAVRAEVGSDYPVGCRFLTRDIVMGGSEVEDAVFFGVAFAKAGMDFLSMSRGGRFEDARRPAVGQAVYPYTGPSGFECMPTALADARGPFGRNAADAAQVRAAIRQAGLPTPLVVAGGICSYSQAEDLLQSGQADLIGSARQSLADPDWWRKVYLGRGGEVRRCLFSNYCEGLDQKHKQVTCQLWDRLDLERDQPRLSLDGKRRLTAPDWQE